jgi:hypothetical protein
LVTWFGTGYTRLQGWTLLGIAFKVAVLMCIGLLYSANESPKQPYLDPSYVQPKLPTKHCHDVWIFGWDNTAKLKSACHHFAGCLPSAGYLQAKHLL